MSEVNDRIESNSDLAGMYREVPECGLTCVMTKEAYEKTKNGEFGNYGQTLGRKDGLFVAPKDQIDDILEEADGNFNEICEKLGIDPKDWTTAGDCLMRIDISKEDADKLNPRYPTGNEGGASDSWIGGGKTGQFEYTTNKETKVRESKEVGLGADEYVIDMVDVNELESFQEDEIPVKNTYQARYNEWHSQSECGDAIAQEKLEKFDEYNNNKNPEYIKFSEKYIDDFVKAYGNEHSYTVKVKDENGNEKRELIKPKPEESELPSVEKIRHAYLQDISDRIEAGEEIEREDEKEQ